MECNIPIKTEPELSWDERILKMYSVENFPPIECNTPIKVEPESEDEETCWTISPVLFEEYMKYTEHVYCLTSTIPMDESKCHDHPSTAAAAATEQGKSADTMEETPPSVSQPSTVPVGENKSQLGENVKKEFAGKSKDTAPEDAKGEQGISGQPVAGNSKDMHNMGIPECYKVDLHTVASSSSSSGSREEGKNENISVTKFTCPMCRREFPRKRFYDRHVALHNNACFSCFRRFPFNHELKLHLRESLDPKYGCLICLVAFHSRDNLRSHMLCHSEERRYRCSVCEMRFNDRSDLTGHMKIHRGFSQYQCTVCSGYFKKVQSLKYHMTLHTGEKVYSCEFCREKFIRCSDLATHRDRHFRRPELLYGTVPPCSERW